jgi:hypothetical protein
MVTWMMMMSEWPQDSAGLQMGLSTAHTSTMMLTEIGVDPAAGNCWGVSLGGSTREGAEPLAPGGITVEVGSGESLPVIAECLEGACRLLLAGQILVQKKSEPCVACGQTLKSIWTPLQTEVAQKNSMHKTSLAIVIEPTVVFGSVEPQPSLSSVTNCGDAEFAQQQVSLSNAIVIVPQEDQSLGNRPGPDNASHNVPAKITQPETEPVESCQKPAESVGGRTLASSSPRVCDEVVLPTQEIPGAFVLQSDKSMENPYASISPH